MRLNLVNTAKKNLGIDLTYETELLHSNEISLYFHFSTWNLFNQTLTVVNEMQKMELRCLVKSVEVISLVLNNVQVCSVIRQFSINKFNPAYFQ